MRCLCILPLCGFLASSLAWAAPEGTSTPSGRIDKDDVPRCWFLVRETVVPVNLPDVTVRVEAGSKPATRRVLFQRKTPPYQLVHQLEVDAGRAAELQDEVSERLEYCFGPSGR